LETSTSGIETATTPRLIFALGVVKIAAGTTVRRCTNWQQPDVHPGIADDCAIGQSGAALAMGQSAAREAITADMQGGAARSGCSVRSATTVAATN
jgi:hypothetical protein